MMSRSRFLGTTLLCGSLLCLVGCNDGSGDPKAQQCGWLKDKYGLSWQIVPTVLNEMMQDPNRKKAEAVMAALMPMVKLDIATLTKAYDAIEEFVRERYR